MLGAGVLFLGFSAFRGTASFAENLIAYAFHVGVKIFFLYLLVAVGVHLTSVWADYLLLTILDPFDLTIYSQILAGSLVLAGTVIYLFEVGIVVTIQAFVFALLSAIYIGAAIEPEH